MKVYDPQIKVTLIKTQPRTGLSFDDLPPHGIKGQAVDGRYHKVESLRIDLTKYLGDGSGVRTSKSVREPAGGFSITLFDRLDLYPSLDDSLYAMIEPMDLIEIRFCHDAEVMNNTELKRGLPPIIMRGFISEVTRDESMGQDGKPLRRVNISGQDSGKILESLIIYYLSNVSTATFYMTEFNWFEKYHLNVNTKSASTCLNEMVEKVLNPYLARIVSTSDDDVLGKGFVAESSILGSVSPFVFQAFQDVSLHAVMSGIFDVGAFNELFVEDRENEVALVLRELPFKDANGDYCQSQEKKAVSAPIVTADDIQSISATRTDHGIANWYWVTASRWMLGADSQMRLAVESTTNSTMFKQSYPNCAADRYGFRKMQIDTCLSPPVEEKEVNGTVTVTETKNMTEWFDQRRLALGNLNKDNVVFESGTMRIFGNEAIKAGMFIWVQRGNAKSYSVYVVSIEHEFMPLHGFFSTIHYERGTGFIERAKNPQSPYLQEFTAGGI